MMAKTFEDTHVPEIFNDIIRERVSKYISKEVKEMIQKEIDNIIVDVLGTLQLDSTLYLNMARYEKELVVKAIYNGEDITQKKKRKKK